jgi:hypothetical protein
VEYVADPFVQERAILKLCYEREEVRSAIAPIISAEWFYDNGLKRVAKGIAVFVSEYGDFPTKSDVSLFIGSDDDALESFSKAMALDVSEFTDDHLLDGIESYVKQKLLAESAHALAEAVSTGADDDEVEKLSDQVEASRGFKFNVDKGLNVFGDPDALWDEMHAEHNFVRTNIQALDAFMRGGLARGHTTVLFAEAGFGKTAGMGSIATNTALGGAKTLYITMELSKGYLGTRLVQSALGRSNEDVFRMSKEQLREAITTGIGKECRSNLYVEEVVPGSNTFCVKKILKDYARRGIKFDVVVTDYLQLFTPTRKLNGANSNELMKWVSIELNAYAKAYDFAHLTAAQVNRGGYDKADFGMDAVAEGISIAQNVSAIWGMMATEEQLALGHITLKSLKNRFGKKNVKNVVELDFDKMQLRDIEKSEALSREHHYKAQQGVDAVKSGSKPVGGMRGGRTSVKGIAV